VGFGYFSAEAALCVGGSPSCLSNVPVGGLVGTSSVNTLLIRLNNDLVDQGAVAGYEYRVTLTGGEVLGTGTLVGDVDANYVLFQDSRLADGFAVGGGYSFSQGSGVGRGSNLAMNFKVGSSRVPVPEPATALLLLTGALGLAARRRA
jgi:hypothetical protein